MNSTKPLKKRHHGFPVSAVVACCSLMLVPAAVAETEFVEPTDPTAERILQKLLERRTFTAAEILEIDQSNPKDGVIDVRDLALYYNANPRPTYAFFDDPSSTLPTWSGSAANVLICFTKPYTGQLNYQLSGTALVGKHFALSAGQTMQNGVVVGSVNVNGTTATIPILPVDRQQFAGPATLTLAITGYRDVANQAARFALKPLTTSNSEGVVLGTRVRQLSDFSVWQVSNVAQLANAAGWQQVPGTSYDYGSGSTHLITIVEADRGLYSGMIRFEDGANLDPQPLRVAFRSNGTAVFDVSQAPLFGPSNFSLPVTYPGLPAVGNPRFAGATTALRAMGSSGLGRTVSWRLALSEPAAPIATVTDDVARYALTGLAFGALVRQQTPAPATVWRVANADRLSSPAGWMAVDETAWNLLSTLTLTGVTGSSAGLSLKGTLRLERISQ